MTLNEKRRLKEIRYVFGLVKLKWDSMTLNEKRRLKDGAVNAEIMCIKAIQ